MREQALRCAVGLAATAVMVTVVVAAEVVLLPARLLVAGLERVRCGV